MRLRDQSPPGAIPLVLPARSMRGPAAFMAIAFVIFAAIEWMTVASMFSRPVEDVFDLVFTVFQGFWALGWSVGVVILGALAILLAFYSESARLENSRLVHIANLGPLKILGEYDLAKVSDVRLEQVSGSDRDTVRVRFDYDGGTNSLGDTMPRANGQRIIEAITSARRFASTFAADAAAVDKPFAPNASTFAADAATVDKPTAPGVSSLALIAANLVPVPGVLVFGWDLGNILLLYWAESGVIALYTVLKIAIVGKLGALVAVPFFVGHFGGFMSGHFLLIYGLFLRNIRWQPPGAMEGLRAIFVPIWGSIAALIISHGISFYTNFLGQREHEGAKVSALMTAPYNRIIVMHLTLILGGWIILLVGMPAGALVVLVALKTAVDLWAHRREHR